MSGFDFAVDDGSTVSNNSDDTEEVPDLVSSEVGDLYLSSVDWEMSTFRVMDEEGYEKLKISGSDTLDDVSRLLGEYSEAHVTQKLHMVAALFKSTAGKLQTGQVEGVEENDHGIGLSSSKAPEEHPENYFSYALFSKDLPSISWDDLDGGEREVLQNEYDIDPSQLGFDTTYGGPKLLEVNGNRLPIAVTEGNEIQEALEILSSLPDVPSGYTEDGFRESSDPSVFGEGDSDNPAEGSDDEEPEDFDLASNPERVKDVTVTDLRSGPNSVTDITSLRSIQTMLRVEKENDPRSSAVKRLEERRNALQGTDEADTESGEAVTDGGSEESVEDVEDDEWSEADKNMMATLVETGNADSIEEAAEQLRSL